MAIVLVVAVIKIVIIIIHNRASTTSRSYMIAIIIPIVVIPSAVFNEVDRGHIVSINTKLNGILLHVLTTIFDIIVPNKIGSIITVANKEVICFKIVGTTSHCNTALATIAVRTSIIIMSSFFISTLISIFTIKTIVATIHISGAVTTVLVIF